VLEGVQRFEQLLLVGGRHDVLGESQRS